MSPKTPNDIVYGETGKISLKIRARTNVIKYWLRLTRMENARLPRKAYDMLCSIHNKGKHCWVSEVQIHLASYGFAFVWLNQGVEDINQFLRVYKERLSDCWRQEWDERIQTSSRYETYRTFKSSISLESYFSEIHNKKLRDVFIRFRLGISELKPHKLRYSNGTSNNNLACPLCSYRLDDEKHFLFHCPATKQLRIKYIPHHFTSYGRHNLFDLNILNDTTCMTNVARFIYYSLKKRANCEQAHAQVENQYQ